MFRETIQQKVVIENGIGKIFEAEYNAAMKRLAQYSPQVVYPSNVPGHCCYITYTEEIIEPENAQDELELKGYKPMCGECPFYEEPGDRRKKTGLCTKEIEPAPYYTKRACMYLCEMVMAKIIDIGYEI